MAEKSNDNQSFKVAIVGSGPSAFYAAQALFKADQDIAVDMLEKLPTPFGLLRGGVAPDHQQMKTISKAYEKIASHDQFRFFGNVTVGKDITFNTLKDHYHAVIIAIGAETDRKLNIDGEDATGSYTATEFVAWYNGHPDYQTRNFDLSGKHAVVIGQGNVAVDVTRILAKPIEALQTTDITQNAIEALKESKIEHIYMVGRRGPAQAAFTELELKELGNIPDVNLEIHDNLELSEADQEEIETSSKARKNCALLKQQKEAGLPYESPKKTIHILFYRSPNKINVSDTNHVTSILCDINQLSGQAGAQKARATGETQDVPADILFRSIGYKGVGLEGVPFNEQKGVIPNNQGQVVDADGNNVPNTFVTGWIKRGPSGVIGTNRSDSIETVASCLSTLDAAEQKNTADIEQTLTAQNIQYISYKDWKIIDQAEIVNGQKIGKPREKFTSLNDILDLLKK